MKKKFSTKWKASVQPRKQRKFIANAPYHIKASKMNANLSKKLREKYKRRSLTLRKDDTVKVMRGEFRKKSGKINNIYPKKETLSIEGIFRTKKDGAKIAVYFHPSNLMIEELNLSDKKRIKAIERKSIKKEENKDSDQIKNKKIKENKKNALKKK